jgi:hypothetical protein
MTRQIFIFLLIAVGSSNAVTSEIDGHIVQFVVYAAQESDITRFFPGASVQFTWNNVFVVQMWTHDPSGLVTEIQSVLDKNPTDMQLIVPPMALAAATQKWIEFNLVWVLLLLMIFIAGCACGGVLVNNCLSIKQAVHKKRTCHTGS